MEKAFPLFMQEFFCQGFYYNSHKEYIRFFLEPLVRGKIFSDQMRCYHIVLDFVIRERLL